MTDAELNIRPFPVKLRLLDVADHRDQLREMTDALHHAAVILRMLDRDDQLSGEAPWRFEFYERRALCYFANHTLDMIAAGQGSDTAKFTDQLFYQIREQAQKLDREEKE